MAAVSGENGSPAGTKNTPECLVASFPSGAHGHNQHRGAHGNEQRGDVGQDQTRSDRRTFLAGGLRAGAAVSGGALVGAVSGATGAGAQSATQPGRQPSGSLAVDGSPGPPTGLAVNGMDEPLGV
ncbi:MAG TPA: hypothetical protein VEJ84_16675, partial [Acidimicrobiales bacterium]|nr:hypothetical protein [Acidimicrobiales bacterium]